MTRSITAASFLTGTRRLVPRLVRLASHAHRERTPKQRILLITVGWVLSYTAERSEFLLHLDKSRTQVPSRMTDKAIDRVKRANHLRRWGAKPRDLGRDGVCSRVSLAATPQIHDLVAGKGRTSWHPPSSAKTRRLAISRMEVPHDIRHPHRPLGTDRICQAD